MSERLSELTRQREIIRQHLAWLDREIAREQPADSSSLAAAGPAVNLSSVSSLPGANQAAPSVGPQTPEVEAILARYREQSRALRADNTASRRVYSLIAFLVLMAVIAVGYYIYLQRLQRLM
jgi:hypothetical protein